MPNVAKALKQEIARVARKEIRLAVSPLRASSAAARRGIASLKRQVAMLVKSVGSLDDRLAGGECTGAAAPAAEPAAKARITAKGIRSLRRRLGLSVIEFAALMNVTEQSVRNWERAAGVLRLREPTRKLYIEVRDIGVREARERIAAKAASAKAEQRAKARKPGRKARGRKAK